MATLVDKYFSAADLQSITQAVKEAEQKSAGEIVVMLAPHAKHWLADRLVFSSLLGIVASVVSLYFTRESHWGTYFNYTQAALWGIIAFVVGYFGIFAWYRSRTRRRKAVWNSALKRFGNLRPTKGLTGVLIYVSMEEEEAAVIADKAIADKVAAEYWHHPHSLIIKGMRQGRHAEGIVEAIQEIGTQLAQFFPRQSDDINELPDGPEIIK